MKARIKPLRTKTLALSLLAVFSMASAGSALAAKDVVLALSSQPDTLDPYNTNTTLTTLVTIVCLYIFGVSSIREFALPIIVGIISGVYSANMINGYVWAFLEEKKRARKAAKA